MRSGSSAVEQPRDRSFTQDLRSEWPGVERALTSTKNRLQLCRAAAVALAAQQEAVGGIKTTCLFLHPGHSSELASCLQLISFSAFAAFYQGLK